MRDAETGSPGGAPRFNRETTALGDIVEIEVRCPVETRVLSLLRTLVTALATDLGFCEEEVERIELAVDEACTNVVRHAYKHLGVSPDLPPERRLPPPPDVDCVLRLRTILHAEWIKIIIMDNGIGLHNTPPGVNSIEEYLERRGTGGLGNYIIRNFMDEVHYDFPPERGTILTMTKYLNPAVKK